MSDAKPNLYVSVAEPSGKTPEEREAAVRESGVADAVAQALYRERLLRTNLDGLERREKVLMARIEELEAERDQAIQDVAIERDSTRKLAGAEKRVFELEADLAAMTDRYHEASKQQMLLHDRLAAREGKNPCTADFEPPAARAYTVGDAAGLKRLPDEPAIFPTRGMSPEETGQQMAKELQRRGYTSEVGGKYRCWVEGETTEADDWCYSGALSFADAAVKYADDCADGEGLTWAAQTGGMTVRVRHLATDIVQDVRVVFDFKPVARVETP